MDRIEVVLIAGPTASGKSALAAALARRLGGPIVNADSMQVYRDLRILTARPGAAEEAALPHRLYGTVDAAQNFSVGRYLEAVGPVLAQAWAEGDVPVVVGGTGLYFKALTEGLSQLPPVPDAVRDAVRAGAEGRPTGELHAELARSDPASAERLRPSDRLRITRALEVLAATGRSIGSFHGSRRPGPLAGRRMAKVFLSPDRAALRQRIDRRFEDMLAAGALDEVARLRDRRLDPALPAMRAHGVPALLAHLCGEISLQAAADRGKADTRAYAKRQFTWFRHQMPGFTAVAPEMAEAEIGRLLGLA